MGLKTKFINYLTKVRKIEALKKDFSERELKALKSLKNTVLLDSPEKPAVSILILSSKEARHNFSLASIKENTKIDFEIIVVLEDDTELNNFTNRPNITVVTKSTSVIDDINTAIELAKGEFVYFLNDQFIPSENFLEEALNVFSTFADAGIAGSQLISKGKTKRGFFFNGTAKETEPIPAYYPEVNKVSRVDYFSDFNFLIKKNSADSTIVKLDNKFPNLSSAILDLCFFVKYNQNKQIYVTPFSKVYATDAGAETVATLPTEFKLKWKDNISNIKSKTVEERYQELYNNKSILFFSGIFPEHDKDSGSNRLKEIIERFYDLGYLITIVSKNTHFENSYIAPYLRMGISVFYEHNEKIPTEKYVESQKLTPEKIWVYGPNSLKKYYQTIEKNFKNSTTIFDMIDVHFLRYKRALELHPNSISTLKRYNKYFFIETQIAKNADIVVAISDIEKEIMSDYLDPEKIITISNIHYPKMRLEDVKNFESRNDLVFIGSAHKPNIDAIYYIYQEIMPLVWEKLPQVNLKIVGNVSEHIKDISHPNIQFLGYVESVNEIFNESKMMVAPLRYGAGVKGKIGQAFEYYLPVVTTEIGAEGMFLKNQENALIANDAGKFAENIIELYQNDELWNKLSANSEDSLYPFSKEKLREIIKNIE